MWVDFDVTIVFPAGRKKRGKLRFKDEVEVEMGLFESAAQDMVRITFFFFPPVLLICLLTRW